MSSALNRHHGLVVSTRCMGENNLVWPHKIVSPHYDNEQRLSYAFDVGRRTGVGRLVHNTCDIIRRLVVFISSED